MKLNNAPAKLYWESYEIKNVIVDYSVTHIRNKIKGKKGQESSLNPKGGATVVSIMFSDCGLITGKAECSNEDFFDKAIGRTVAFLRIVDARNKILRNRNNPDNGCGCNVDENDPISESDEYKYWFDEEATLLDPNDYKDFTANQVIFGYADINSAQGKDIFDILTKICNGDYNKK